MTKGICSVAGCDKPRHATNRMCAAHIYRRRHGIPLDQPFNNRFGDDHVARFKSKLKMVEATGCVEWTGTVGAQGYGVFRVGSRTVYAHRWWYEQQIGPILAETLDHLCLNRICVNLEHLEPVSRAENTRREMLQRWGH